MAFREDEHPRDGDGKFTDKEGGMKSKAEKLREAVNIYSDDPVKDVRYRQDASYDKIIEDENDSYFLPDEILPRSLGAKWANYDIAMPDGTVAHFAEGSKLHNIEVFAGKGTKKPIRDVDRLVKTYGGKPEDWMKVKGIGTISYRGEENKAEIHWYQANGGGKEELKFKRYV